MCLREVCCFDPQDVASRAKGLKLRGLRKENETSQSHCRRSQVICGIYSDANISGVGCRLDRTRKALPYGRRQWHRSADQRLSYADDDSIQRSESLATSCATSLR